MDEGVLCKSQLEDLTYPRPRIKNFTLDDNLPASGFPPDDRYIREPPKVDLGALDVPPLELLQAVLTQLDLRSLTEFRRVNRRAVEVVDSITQYQAIAKQARNVLRGILTIGIAQWITCETVYEKLCTAECEQCGDFGGYLYILTCKRVCFLCLSEAETYLPLRRSHAIRKFGLDRQILNTLPCMRSIPGTYSPNGKKCREPLVLVDFESAYRAGIMQHGSVSAMDQYVSNISSQKLQKFNKATARATIEGSTTRRPRRPQTEDVFDGRSGNPIRYMAIVRMPWLDKAAQKLEWGFHCAGCRKFHVKRPLHYRRKFTLASFSEHLTRCGRIVNGKHHLG